MNFKETILVLHFLTMLKEQSETELLEPITKSFLYVLPREKLLAIIEHMTGKGSHPEHPDFSALSDEVLLNWIKDQYYILDYLIAELEATVKL